MKYSKQRVINKSIPDNNPNGLSDVIKFHRNLSVKSVSLSVNINHPFNGDVSIKLTGPNGNTVNVLNPSRKGEKNIKTTFTVEGFSGIKSKGNWTIQVIDSGARDSGTLIDWTLNFELANAKKSEVFIVDESDLVSSQICHQGGTITDITAHVEIEHGYVGDLILNLTSPSGTTVVIRDKVGGNKKGISQSYNKSVLAKFIGEKSIGKWTMTVNDTMPRDNGVLVAWKLNMATSVASTPVASASKKGHKDDLTKIEGIGPKINGLLNDGGIFTFSGLANTKVERLQDILNKAGNRYKVHNPGSWPTQSDLAAKGKWEELNKLQDELNGGK